MEIIHNLFAISMYSKKEKETFFLYAKVGYNKMFQSEVTQLVASKKPEEVTLYYSVDEAKSQILRYKDKLKNYTLEVVHYNIEIKNYRGI